MFIFHKKLGFPTKLKVLRIKKKNPKSLVRDHSVEILTVFNSKRKNPEERKIKNRQSKNFSILVF